MLEYLSYLAQGNKNASECLTGIINGSIDNATAGIVIIPKINKCLIMGDNLANFYVNICGRDYTLMGFLCKNVPDDKLVEACSKRGELAREVVREWIEVFSELPITRQKVKLNK